ncbi:venom carboxylesterase-6 [Papilio machaon]|uniref:venom carboxylesterase-6 n=1 Tax=Papilio machaon TaxID=76193 RepID=UPI001E665850|nr:venom carboxylesterase-6 [Papilio machaon]
MELIKFILCVFALAIIGAQGSNPVVRVAHGVLQGSWKVSTNGRNYASFEGIPYARPPIGKYRFREPQQMKPWLGVWDATKPLAECLQYDPFAKKVTGSENCLYLNVHTPKPNAGALLPVLVFIHGGAFMYGAGGPYDASHIMDRDMVVVTLNYRLGPLGFLSTGDEVIPGNAGLKDQSFALQWVKSNIMMFGGDPDSVTLTGCSAGGASVHYHYLSPMSRDTFHRGIAFSGSAFASWTHAVKPAQKARSLAAAVGCPTTNTKEMADCLRYRPAEVVVNGQVDMFEWKVNLFTPFTPTHEAPNTKYPFLTQYPYHVAKAGGMQKLPLITSVTSEEGLYPAAAYQTDPTILKELESRWEQLASNIFEYNDTLPLQLRSAVADKIKQQYFAGKPIGQDTFDRLVQALGDRLFAADVGRLAQTHASSGQPTYLYRYSFRGNLSLSNLIAQNDKNYGVSHADDVMSIFKFIDSSDSPDDVQMRQILLDMIYSYASTGVPTITNGPHWQTVVPGSQELNYLEIATPTDITMKTSSDFGNRSFWDNLGFVENQNYNIYIKDELY